MKFAMFSSSKPQKDLNEILSEVKKSIVYRCAFYIRVSTDRETQKSSIKNQKELAIKIAKEKGWEIVEFYIDIESGTSATKREGLKRLISDAKLKKFDIIASKEISRLSRNGALSYHLRDTLLENKIHIYTHDGAIDTTTESMENFGLYVWLAERESQTTSTRIKRMFETEAANGKFVGSDPPYGYSVVNKKLIIKEDDTPNIVKRIFKEYLEGKGFDAIARGLYNDDIPTPAEVAGREIYSDKWHGSSVRKILTNPHYAGMLVQLRDTKRTVTSKRITNPIEETVIIENTHDPIIPVDVFFAVQDQIDSRKRIRPQQEVHLFTNTAFCAECGRGMHYKKNRKGYVCGNYNKHGIKACSEHFIKEDALEEIILSDIKTHISKLDLEGLISPLEEKVNSKTLNEKKRLKNIDKEIAELNKEKIHLTKYFIKAKDDNSNFSISEQDYKMTIEDTNAKIEALINERVGIEKNLGNTNTTYDIVKIKENLSDLLDIKKLTPEILHRFVSRIEIKTDGTPRIVYRF